MHRELFSVVWVVISEPGTQGATATSVRERVCLGHELVCESESLLGMVLVLIGGGQTNLAEIGEFWRHRCSGGRYGVGGGDGDEHRLLAVAGRSECFGRLEQPQRKGRRG